MTDDHVPAKAGIVERLRNRNNPENRRVMMTEAADEIERLREHVAALQLVATAHEPEIERLRFENSNHIDVINDLLAQIERLRAALQLIRDDAMSPPEGPRDLWIEEVARRALEPKP